MPSIMKYLKIFFIVLFFYSSYSHSQCTEIFISEYIEGSSNNKYIEIYNPTNATIVLTGNYDIRIFSNGNTTASNTISLIGAIASNSTFILKNSGDNLSVIADQQSGALNFNGDDAVALTTNTGILLDVIGQIGFDPGTQWVGSTCTEGTADGTLVRNSNVLLGDNNGSDTFNPDTEWTCFSQNTITNLGSHTSNCVPTNEIQLQQPIGTNIACGYTYDYGIQNIGTNTHFVLTILNTGSIDLTINNLSFTTGTNFSVSSTTTLPLVIPSNGTQDITIQFNPTTLGIFNDTLIITNDDSNEGACTVALQGEGNTSCSTTTTNIAVQDFEGAVSDTWSYTANHAAITNFWYETTSLSNITAAQSGTNFWGMTDLERSGHNGLVHELSFNTTDISTFNNVKVSFNYYTVGIDASDSLKYQLFYDTVPQGLVDISLNTSSWTQVQVTIPDVVNNIQIIFYADVDAANDQAGIDNVTISSTSINEAIWNGTVWNNGTGPTSAMSARISGDYNTSITNPNFTACSLIVDTGSTLTIDENYTIEIENNVINNGFIRVDSNGSFVQNSDVATFTNSVNNNSQVTKKTAIINAWYEYTYWSSPVVGEQIQDAFATTNPDRRFWYNAANFKDAGYETGNDNVLIINATSGGVDGVDDNANDWQYAAATSTLKPGVGYAATLSPTAYNASPNSQFDHIFQGPFNNGIITVPVYRNDDELNDFNNNFIGNPYPSAIDFDLFMAENGYTASNPSGTIDGAIYLWSQATAPSTSTNGNSDTNFGHSDYAIINETMETAGGDNDGDGIITAADKPNRYIPSGQSFFINYHNSGGVVSTATNSLENNDLISEGAVIFRNSMRVIGNNNQFFKSSNMPIENNKLWLTLSSNNGVGSQIGIGYVNNATDGDDGARFDAIRNATTGMAAFFYSTIQDSDKKLAIQGKTPQSLTLDEIIPLGIYTSIEIPTIYSISISQFQGDFFNNNNIYLKDKLLNITHDLTVNSYAFTSDAGDFTERFEILFTNNTLSTNNFEATTNTISIVELQNNNVKFSTKSKELTIDRVVILDVLGREIYNFRGSENTETYNLSNLSRSVYIAKIELSNGQIISKKAVKK